jgi:hypothetical protein
LADQDNRFITFEGDLLSLKWMTGSGIALKLAILARA